MENLKNIAPIEDFNWDAYAGQVQLNSPDCIRFW